MNQILSVENNSKKEKSKKVRSSGPMEIDTILRFFAIAILIFGVFLIGSASYSMYKGEQEADNSVKPTIAVEGTAEGEITLRVTHTRNLSKVTYTWSGGQVIEVPCEGKKSVEEKIQIPTGTNTLTVYASDVNGLESQHSKTYTLQGDITIELEVEGNDIKIIAEGKEELSYITYRWDEEDETQIDVNDIQTEQTIEIPKGLHTLTVIAVDINNKTETKQQEVNGVTKPTLEVTTDGVENFIITSTDEQGLDKIEFIIYSGDETERNRLELDGQTEIEYPYPLHDGENKLEITVYNINGATATEKVILQK